MTEKNLFNRQQEYFPDFPRLYITSLNANWDLHIPNQGTVSMGMCSDVTISIGCVKNIIKRNCEKNRWIV